MSTRWYRSVFDETRSGAPKTAIQGAWDSLVNGHLKHNCGSYAGWNISHPTFHADIGGGVLHSLTSDNKRNRVWRCLNVIQRGFCVESRPLTKHNFTEHQSSKSNRKSGIDQANLLRKSRRLSYHLEITVHRFLAQDVIHFDCLEMSKAFTDLCYAELFTLFVIDLQKKQ